MADVAIITATFGGSDPLRDQTPQDVPVDWIAVTDDPAMRSDFWAVQVEHGRGAHPCMAAKRFKMLPHVGHRFAIWIDANMEVTSPTFAREALESVRDGIAVWQHPRRDCVYAEAEASVGAESQGGKYATQPILEQAASYRAAGYPEHAGLYACGTVVWDRDDPRARPLGFEWLGECERWTFQDQISLPVVAARMGVRPGVFPYSQIARRRRGWLENRWLRIHPHS